MCSHGSTISCTHKFVVQSLQCRLDQYIYLYMYIAKLTAEIRLSVRMFSYTLFMNYDHPGVYLDAHISYILML